MKRRLTTIVAADIAGFSRLVGLDEEGRGTKKRHAWIRLEQLPRVLGMCLRCQPPRAREARHPFEVAGRKLLGQLALVQALEES